MAANEGRSPKKRFTARYLLRLLSYRSFLLRLRLRCRGHVLRLLSLAVGSRSSSLRRDLRYDSSTGVLSAWGARPISLVWKRGSYNLDVVLTMSAALLLDCRLYVMRMATWSEGFVPCSRSTAGEEDVTMAIGLSCCVRQYDLGWRQ